MQERNIYRDRDLVKCWLDADAILSGASNPTAVALTLHLMLSALTQRIGGTKKAGKYAPALAVLAHLDYLMTGEFASGAKERAINEVCQLMTFRSQLLTQGKDTDDYNIEFGADGSYWLLWDGEVVTLGQEMAVYNSRQEQTGTGLVTGFSYGYATDWDIPSELRFCVLVGQVPVDITRVKPINLITEKR
jgi:hypothetical protein